jgi:ribosomal protein S18 acetylase RimI-like enzyme
MATYRAGDVVGVWSVGTSRSDRRHGYAQRLTCSVLSHLRAAGATHAVLLASIPGGPLYRNVGFEVVDDWQMWSRPRWVLGRV